MAPIVCLSTLTDVLSETDPDSTVTTKGFKIIQSDPNVKSVLINIFGGIIHCDMIANGIIDAIKELNYKLPVVVRFQGTNAAEGKNIINKSSLGLVSIDDLTEAAKKVVDLASK